MNAGIRYIYNLRRDSHISPCRSELEWMKQNVKQRPLCFYQALSEQFMPLRRSKRVVHKYPNCMDRDL